MKRLFEFAGIKYLTLQQVRYAVEPLAQALKPILASGMPEAAPDSDLIDVYLMPV